MFSLPGQLMNGFFLWNTISFVSVCFDDDNENMHVARKKCSVPACLSTRHTWAETYFRHSRGFFSFFLLSSFSTSDFLFGRSCRRRAEHKSLSGTWRSMLSSGSVLQSPTGWKLLLHNFSSLSLERLHSSRSQPWWDAICLLHLMARQWLAICQVSHQWRESKKTTHK